MPISEKENSLKMTYHWYTVGHNTIEVGDMTEIFMSIEIGFFFNFFLQIRTTFPPKRDVTYI